ncbi:hypothetical protein [Rhizobium mayense]|uniref:Uncharacterized protein n=1 Tax=Rhizobium mayense TaxID=1312184 RepID=A0ABT7JQ15_9HYPH|nr:hypothetical protein [Rhizobium mayense]MDL2398442.1 hypothetical protein [Rhizobium mayense]
MAKRREPLKYITLFAKITRQELHFGSSGSGSKSHPFRIATYIELAATLDEPFRGVLSVEASLSEAVVGIQGETRIGMVHRTKPMIYVGLSADTKACDRLVSVIAAQRLTDLYLTIEPPRYGKAWVLNWQLRTAPELQ